MVVVVVECGSWCSAVGGRLVGRQAGRKMVAAGDFVLVLTFLACCAVPGVGGAAEVGNSTDVLATVPGADDSGEEAVPAPPPPRPEATRCLPRRCHPSGDELGRSCSTRYSHGRLVHVSCPSADPPATDAPSADDRTPRIRHDQRANSLP